MCPLPNEYHNFQPLRSRSASTRRRGLRRGGNAAGTNLSALSARPYVDRQAGKKSSMQASIQTYKHTDRQTDTSDRQTNRQTDRQTDRHRQTDRQTDRQTGRQTRQTDRQTDIQTDRQYTPAFAQGKMSWMPRPAQMRGLTKSSDSMCEISARGYASGLEPEAWTVGWHSANHVCHDNASYYGDTHAQPSQLDF